MSDAVIRDTLTTVSQLPCFTHPTHIEPLSGGITNVNLRVTDGDNRYVVRLGDDIPEHGVMRWNELALSRAAENAGVSPRVIYSEPGVLVLEFIDATTLDEAAVRQGDTLRRIISLLKTAHHTLAAHLTSPVLAFWPFQVARLYVRQLIAANSAYAAEFPVMLEDLSLLESAVGPVTLVVGHGDMLAANILDDGDRLWLIDWEYGGYSSPLFDLAGLASNNGLNEADERDMLEQYFEAPHESYWSAYQAMKCTSLLRETLWSMTAEVYSTLDFDYVAYTAENRQRLSAAMHNFRQL